MADYPYKVERYDEIKADNINKIIDTAMKSREMRGANGMRVSNTASGMSVSTNLQIQPSPRGSLSIDACNLHATKVIPAYSAVCIKGSIDWDEEGIERPLLFEVSSAALQESEIYGVATEQILPDGGTGNVVIAGMSHALLYGPTLKKFVDVVTTSDFFIYGDTGLFPVVWNSSEVNPDGTRLGIILLGSSADAEALAYGDSVPRVSVLPPIPTVAMKEVFWIPDGQVWRAYKGQTSWTPTQYSSTRSGVPGSP